MIENKDLESELGAVPVELLPEEQEVYWYSEHAALFITTVKWAFLGALSGLCVGLATRFFLYILSVAAHKATSLDFGFMRYYYVLPIALPVSVYLIKKFAPTAKGHGTEAVITAIHTRSGKIDLAVAPIKLVATIITLAFGGSVGKEGPCAQIGAAISSAFADILRLNDADRRRLVICGIGAGFAAVFGTPVSGALFGIEVLYLGRIEYSVLFPCLIAGIIAHFVCGTSPPVIESHLQVGRLTAPVLALTSLAFGILFGLAARLLIDSMAAVELLARRLSGNPYTIAVAGGMLLILIYSVFGESYAGLGVGTIALAMHGAVAIALAAFVIKIVATSVTLETGGSGGIVTPLFFIGSTLGAAVAHLLGLPPAIYAAFGFVAVLAAAANTPIAAAVMGIEILPNPLGVYAALCACTAFLVVGHRSVYSSQRLGFSKAAGLTIPLEMPIGDLKRSDLHITPGTLTERFHRSASRLPRIRTVTVKRPKPHGE